MSTPPSDSPQAGSNGSTAATAPRILYCHCKYAKVIPPDVKEEVLSRLSASGVGFDAVADLCEMSARKYPALQRLASPGSTKIAACFPRAVKWLFHAAGTSLKDDVEILNMREQSAGDVVAGLLSAGSEQGNGR